MIIPSSRYVPFPETEQRIEYRAELTRVLGYKVVRCSVSWFTVTERSDRTVSITFSGNAVVSIPCSRCLRPVEVEIDFDGDRRLDPEKQCDEDGEPAECFSEEGIDGDVLIGEEIVLRLPMQTYCKDDCKGLCPICGSDLNLGECRCSVPVALTPMQEALMKALSKADGDSK